MAHKESSIQDSVGHIAIDLDANPVKALDKLLKKKDRKIEKLKKKVLKAKLLNVQNQKLEKEVEEQRDEIEELNLRVKTYECMPMLS